MRNLSKIAALAVVLALATIEPAGADGPFFSQKFYGYVALSASGWMFGEAVQARQNANEAYDRYRRASTSADAQTFYDESRRFDTRTVVMGALGAGALAWSVKLLRGKKREELPLPKIDAPSLQIKGIGVDLQGVLLWRRVHLTLSKDF